MADTDILLGIDFDTKDAVSTAKNLGKEVDEIFKQDSGTENTAILNLDNQMKSSVVSADKLVKKLQTLAETKTPTDTYSKLQNNLASLTKEFDKLMDQNDKLVQSKIRFEQLGESADKYRAILKESEKVLAEGKINGRDLSVDDTMKLTDRIKELKQQIADTEKEMNSLSKDLGKFEEVDGKVQTLADSINKTEKEMQQLVDTGKAFTLGKDTEEYIKTERELNNINSKLNVSIIKHRQMVENAGKIPPITERIKKSWSAIGGILVGLNSKVNSIVGKWKNATKQVITHRKEIDRTNLSLTGLVKKLLMYGLGFHGLFSLIGKLRSVLTQGFEDVYASKQLTGLNDKIDELKASLATLRNAFVGAFAPIVEMVIPYLQRLVEWLTKVVGMVAQFIAALTGKSTYLRAIKQRKKAIGEEKDELEDENEALEEQQRQLSGLDKLNVLNSPRTPKATNKDKKKKAEEEAIGPLFEEVPIDSKIKDFAEKIKKMLRDLLYPIKEAWKKTKDFVLSSWKKAIDSMKKLAKTVWDDFIEVWKSPLVVGIWEKIFKIIGNIGLLISVIADKIREAWEYNDNGKKMLIAIAEIIDVIVGYLLKAIEYTVEWAKELDLKPLFDKIREWLESLKRPIQFIMQLLYDFYTKVILKFAGFLLEDENGFQKLLNIFIKFNEEVAWDRIRAKLGEVWDALEPFLERAWEGFTMFIGEIAEKVKKFVNSQDFMDFLDKVKEWLNSVSAEDIKNTFWAVINAVVALKLAVAGYKTISGFTTVMSTLQKFMGLFGGGKAVAAAKGATTLAGSATSLAAALGQLAAVLATGGLGLELGDELQKSVTGMSMDDFTDKDGGIWRETKALFDAMIYCFSDISDAAKEGDWKRIGADIVMGLGAGISGAFEFLFEPIKHLFEYIFGTTEDQFGIASPAKAMYPIGENILLGIVEGFKSKIEEITQPIIDLKNKIIENWDSIKTDTQAKWTEIKQSVSSKVLEIKTDIQAKFAEMKANIFGKMAEIKQNWINGWNLIKSKVQSVVATIKGLVGSLMSWVNSKIASMKSAWDGAVQKFSQTPIGRAVSGVKNFFNAPPAATGAVIPPQMSQRVFTVGDNNSETEVISPLSTMRQAMIEALQQANIGNNSGGGDIVVQIDGREVFRAVQTQATQYSNQHGGRSAFAGA